MRPAVVVVITCLTLASFACAEDYASLNNDGNLAFSEKNYKGALDLYRQAEVERPETPEIYYNQANALVESENYEEAVKKFAKALFTDDLDLQAGVYYNGGNGYFSQDSFKTAIEWYQKALELNPDDLDTKYNLELARNRLKEQMERQPKDQEDKEKQENQEKQEKQEEQEEKDKQEEQDKQDQEQQQDEQDKKEEQQQPKENDEQKDEQNQNQEEQEPKPDEMSKEDAMRILRALENSEKDNQKKVKRFKVKGTYVGNDW